jgi:hypothetical protein
VAGPPLARTDHNVESSNPVLWRSSSALLKYLAPKRREAAGCRRVDGSPVTGLTPRQLALAFFLPNQSGGRDDAERGKSPCRKEGGAQAFNERVGGLGGAFAGGEDSKAQDASDLVEGVE